MSKRTPAAEKRSEILRVRLTRREMKMIRQCAKYEAESVPEYVRRTLFKLQRAVGMWDFVHGRTRVL